MKNRILSITTLLLMAVIWVQCKKETEYPDGDPGPQPITDQELYDMTSGTAGYSYYKNSSDVLASSPESAHKQFFRVRFNDIAYAALTDDGKLPEGASFPEGSIIVKELHGAQDGSSESGIVVMIKRVDDPNKAGSDWVWAEYFGSVDNAISVSSKGSACTGCHSTNERDMVRLFNLFP